MDAHLKSYPILSYVLDRIPSIIPLSSPTAASAYDVEQPPSPKPQPKPFVDPLVEQMPHLKDPKVIAAMTTAVSEIAQTRSVLAALGERPDHETVDQAKAKVAEIDSTLCNRLEEVELSSRPPELDLNDWKAHVADKEKEKRDAAEKEKQMYKSIIQLDEMHESYQKLLKNAEAKLTKIYDNAAMASENDKGKGLSGVEEGESLGSNAGNNEEVNEEVVGILAQNAAGNGIDKIDLSGRRLRLLPEAIGKIRGLVALNLCNNQLEALPDSIAGLELLEMLNLSSNLLECLPDSIGMLLNLKYLSISGNKLAALPDSISFCKSLIELDASFNNLTYIPTNIGHNMENLKKLSLQYNKIRNIPTSVGDMKSLQHLDVHFNELHGLPLSIGKLINLETLNLSGNFADLKELPETFGELTKLRELDLSNNQIHELPVTFGRLENLVKLDLEHNPIVVPPVDVVKQGVGAVITYMAKRWCDLLLEEEHKSTLQAKEETETGWLTRNFSRSTSWLKQQVSTVSEYVTSPRGSPRDPCLDQQF